MSKKVILNVNTNEHDMLSCIRELKKFTNNSDYEIRVEEVDGVHYFSVLREALQSEKTWRDKLKETFTSNNKLKNEYLKNSIGNTSKDNSSWKDSLKYDVTNKNTYSKTYNNYSSNYKNSVGYWNNER